MTTDGGSRLRQILAQASLGPQQQQLVELLLALDEESGDPGAASEEQRAPATGRSDDVERELADLRTVNDTAAAALGACQVCWGGDPGCPVCAGRGRPGFAEPDPELFRKLVAPAVRRMRDLAGAAGRTGSARAGVEPPQQQR